MKLKDRKDLFTKAEAELKKRLSDAKADLFGLKMDLTQNKLKNVKTIMNKRNEIALILTALKEKEFKDAKNA